MSQKKPINYLNNKDMLSEIHKSKCSYCEFDDFDKHHQFDLILQKYSSLNKSKISDARKNRAKRISKERYEMAVEEFNNNPDLHVKPKQAEHAIEHTDVQITDLVFRVVTYDHIPTDPGRKKNPKKIAEEHVKLNFIPFKHYALYETDANVDEDTPGYLSYRNTVYEIREVGRSHSKNGEFCDTHGAISPTLAKMLVLLVNRYSQRANWRGYSYVDEMRGQALYQLSHMSLLFDEAKSNNPFAYFTTAITNSFRRILNFEKKQQSIRDDLLEKQGKTPSFTRQLENDEFIGRLRDEASGE
jgi:hypothetical protein